MSGSVSLGGRAFDYLSGAAISAFPAAALLLHASLTRVTKLRQPGRRYRRDVGEMQERHGHQAAPDRPLSLALTLTVALYPYPYPHP